MKLISAKTMIPATAIALGTTAVMGQPGQAYEVTAYFVDTEPVYESVPVESYYVAPRHQINRQAYSGKQTSRQANPGYHYAYYDIARPEYIL